MTQPKASAHRTMHQKREDFAPRNPLPFEEDEELSEEEEDVGRTESQQIMAAASTLDKSKSEKDATWPAETRTAIKKDHDELFGLLDRRKKVYMDKDTQYRTDIHCLLTDLLSTPPTTSPVRTATATTLRTIPRTRPFHDHATLLFQSSQTLLRSYDAVTAALAITPLPTDPGPALDEAQAQLERVLACGKGVAEEEIKTVLQHRRAERLCSVDMAGEPQGDGDGDGGDEEVATMGLAESYFKRVPEDGDGSSARGAEVAAVGDTLRAVEKGVRRMVGKLPLSLT